MRIGLTYNVRPPVSAESAPSASILSQGALPLPGDDACEEYDSPETISALASVLEGLGHEVVLLGDGELLLQSLLSSPRPDVVWNFAEGAGASRSREARVPAVLEMLSIPYSGSDPLTLCATLDKDCAKRLVAHAGVATPPWALYTGDHESIRDQLGSLAFPVFVKPAYEGSSKGILTSSIIDDAEQLTAALNQLYEAYHQPVLVEEFIEGDELTVGLVGNDPPDVLGIMRVLPRETSAIPFVYSLEVKRDWKRQVRYECPARLSARDHAAVRVAALACWQALGCRDVARIDFRLRRGTPHFLEANPLPGLSPDSGDLVILSGLVGISYAALVERILDAALARLKRARPTAAMSPVSMGDDHGRCDSL